MKVLLRVAAIGAAAAFLFSGASAKANTQTWDFTTDPALDANPIQIYQAGFADSGGISQYWKATEGNPGGFLAITWPLGSSTTIARFPDIDDGATVVGFTFECDLRVGNPQQNERAADGHSINFARANDPAVVNDPPTASDFATSGAVETGTTTGLAICFDTWSGNALPDGADIEGIIVRVDNVTVLRQGLATRNGACDDITSLQTGPRDLPYWDNARNNGLMPDAAFAPESWAGLCWQRLRVVVESNGEVTVVWKGNTVLDNFATGFFPSPGRIILAGRTGGADEHSHFDNLTLTTETTGADTTPPTQPTAFTATEVGARRVALSWGASTDDSGLVAYIVSRDGTDISGTLQTTTYEDRGASPATMHSYAVRAVDVSQNASTEATLDVTTVAEVENPAWLLARIFRFNSFDGAGFGGAGQFDMDNVLADAKWPNSPDSVTYINGLTFGEPAFGNTYGDNLMVAISGTLTPPVGGNFQFFVRSDDASRFYLNTTGAAIPDPAADFPIAQEDDCCDAFLEPDGFDLSSTFTPIPLTAGTEYGFLFLVKEGGGGDWGQVAWRLEGDATPANQLQPIRGTILEGVGDPVGASVTITQNPTDVGTTENMPVSFTVAADITSPYTTTPGYQWRRDGTPILGATAATYNIPLVKKAHAGSIDCVVTVPGANATSTAATLTVGDDVTPPAITRVAGSDTFTSATVWFSEPVTQASAETTGNYSISGGVTVSGATLVAPDRVRLTTSQQAEATAYTLTVNGVQDTATPANTIAANTMVEFRSYQFEQGVAKWEFWGGIGGVAVQGLYDDPRYPDNPDQTATRTGYEAPIDFADNHGTRLTAFVTPPATGDYVFFISADDNAEFYLSTDDDPANAVQVAIEPVWNGARQWLVPDRRTLDSEENRSDRFISTAWPGGNTIHLEGGAGQRYYSYLVFKEGGGGDNGAMTYKLASDPDPANGSAAAGGNLIGYFIDPDAGPPEITTQPQSVTVDQNGSATFTVEANGRGRRPFTYQWRHNGVAIDGATQASYTANNLTVAGLVAGAGVNSGLNTYDCVVSGPDGSATSAAAMVFFSNTLFIESEDVDYESGKWIMDQPIGMTGPYPGGDYDQLGSDADLNIDYNADGGGGQPYRAATGIDAGKFNAHATGLPRGNFSVQVNHVVGWNDPGEWYNYTRMFPEPAADYLVVGRLSSGGNPIIAQLDEVTSGAGTDTQTLQKLGVFNPGRATANWDTMEFFALTDDLGGATTVNLGGLTTLRFTVQPGAALDHDYFEFVPAGPMVIGDEISVALDGNNIIFTWPGTRPLVSGDTVNGPWTVVAGATSPHTVANPGTGNKFYGLGE